MLLVVAALALVIWRYLQERTPRALLEGCAVATIAFFVLATRMHERYLFNGVLFTIVCIPFARRYLWGAVALSVVLFANLAYSLQYLNVVTNNVAGANSQNLWGPWTSVLSAVAVGGVLLARLPVSRHRRRHGARGAKPGDRRARRRRRRRAWVAAVRDWFDPREGLVAMRAPLDYAIAGALGVANFILSFVGYWWPAEKVFDEIYFARAGEEYLQNLRIYENTHPPLSKLLVTLSMMLFGGMPAGHGLGGWTGLNAIVGHMSNGDNSYGWRFLDVVFGALVVMLLYAFAKRITGSTIFSTHHRAAADLRRHALRAVADRHARRLRHLLRDAGGLRVLPLLDQLAGRRAPSRRGSVVGFCAAVQARHWPRASSSARSAGSHGASTRPRRRSSRSTSAASATW